jgi:uncharacterized protein
MKSLLVCASLPLAILLSACGKQDADAQGPGPASVQTASAAGDSVVLPSFDCTKAGSEAEKMVCADPSLAALDKELARVFALAEADSQLVPEVRGQLSAMQRGWIKGRDDCWKADDKRQCVVESYVARIHELRQGSANARKADPEGVTVGPLSLACKELDFGIGMTLIAVEPGYAFLEYRDKKVTLTAVPKIPEAAYAGKTFDGPYGLITEGRLARFKAPGRPEVTCNVEEIG